ncbi:MAG: hypothetical protein ACRDGM_19425 [bacterium]
MIKTASRKLMFKSFYIVLGTLMVVLPLTAAYLAFVTEYALPEKKRHVIFMVELSAVWVFAAYWIIKGIEISHMQIDQKAASGRLGA